MNWPVFGVRHDSLPYFPLLAKAVKSTDTALFLAACARFTALADGPFFCGFGSGGHDWRELLEMSQVAVRHQISLVFGSKGSPSGHPDYDIIREHAWVESGRPALYHFEHQAIWDALLRMCLPDAGNCPEIRVGPVWWQGDMDRWKQDTAETLLRRGIGVNEGSAPLMEMLTCLLDELFAMARSGELLLPDADCTKVLTTYVLNRYSPDFQNRVKVDFLSFDLFWARIRRILRLNLARPTPKKSGLHQTRAFYCAMQRAWLGLARRGISQETFIREYAHRIGADNSAVNIETMLKEAANG